MARPRPPVLKVRPISRYTQNRPEANERIVDLARTSGKLEAARELFKKEYGARPDAKRWKRERYLYLINSKGETVTIPKHLAIAEWLEEGGGGRGSGPEPDWDSRRLVSAIRSRSNELRKAHPDWHAGKADLTAAEEFKEAARQYSALNPVDWALERLKHDPWGRKRKRKPA